MNDLTITINPNQRMTSLEIAELLKLRHKNVRRDIKGLIDQGAFNGLKFEPVEYTDAKGEKRPMYKLDFEASMTLMTGYKAKARAKVIKRWMALERGEAAPALSGPILAPTMERVRLEWGQDALSKARSEGASAGIDIVMTQQRDNLPGDFIARLIRYRSHSLTQRETGKLLDVSRDVIKKYEHMAVRAGMITKARKGRGWEVREVRA